MKSLISFMVLSMVVLPSVAATGRVGIVKSPVAAANVATAGENGFYVC